MCSIFFNDDKSDDINDYSKNFEYSIFETPNSPTISYKYSKFKTRSNLFISKDYKYINLYKWIDINSFKLYFEKNYSLQCLNIRNKNAKKDQLILFSQSSLSNLGKILPTLIDLSSFLKINIITYEYNDSKNEKQVNYDVKVLFCFLNKLNYINNIILMGIDVGTIANLSIISCNIFKTYKIKSIIIISPCWIFDLSDSKSIGKTNKMKQSMDKLFITLRDKGIRTFLIHGKNDNVVRYLISLSLAKRMYNVIEWYPKEGTHYNLINNTRNEFLILVKKFISGNVEIQNKKLKRNTINFFKNKENQLNNSENKYLNLSDTEINTNLNIMNENKKNIHNLSNELNITPAFDYQDNCDLIAENLISDDITINQNNEDNLDTGSFFNKNMIINSKEKGNVNINKLDDSFKLEEASFSKI
jgi:hypothetical protein